MQITIEIPDGDTQKAKLLQLMTTKSDIVLSQAFLYAENYCRYGVDVTQKWSTATEQSAILHRAYIDGFNDAMKQCSTSIDEFNKEIFG